MHSQKIAQLAGLTLIALITTGCHSIKRNPVPKEFLHNTSIPNAPHARFTGVQEVYEQEEDLTQRLKKQWHAHVQDYDPVALLAISGGGPQGAFGAGVIKGWHDRGDMPEFVYVTGISTGALSAPFVFAGGEYLDTLKNFYTSLSTDDILKKRNIIEGLLSDALSDTAPLREILRQAVDEEMVQAIAAEHNKGRRLYIGTTNLDRMEQVFWSIGAIASSAHPNKGELISQIMLASASIPGVFPPVYIEVEAGGQPHDEMHVDGGVSTQVFAYPPSINLKSFLDAAGVSEDRRLYIIRNAHRDTKYTPVQPKLFDIASHSVSGLIRTQGFGDLYEMFLTSKRDEIDFNLMFIPDDFDAVPTEPFDTAYMTKLFETGYALGQQESSWQKTPPGYTKK